MRDEVAAGYLIVRPARGRSLLLPAEVLSASDCVCAQFPRSSALSWSSSSAERRNADFDAIGLPRLRRRDAEAWATSEFGVRFGWPGVFYSAAAAIEVRNQLFGPDSKLAVLGIGLPRMWLDAFLAEAPAVSPSPGIASLGECGHVQTVARMKPLEASGESLGFELLNLEFGQLSHSWLCNSLEVHCDLHLGIRPGPAGFLASLESANRCREEISREEVGSEPGLWLPLLVVRYA